MRRPLAGVCLDHAVIVERRLTRPAVMLREVPVDPPARLLRCPTCHAARCAANCQAEVGGAWLTPATAAPCRSLRWLTALGVIALSGMMLADVLERRGRRARPSLRRRLRALV